MAQIKILAACESICTVPGQEAEVWMEEKIFKSASSICISYRVGFLAQVSGGRQNSRGLLCNGGHNDSDLLSLECECMLTRSSHTRLCNAMDCSLPGSSVHKILQATILEWVAMPFSRGSSQPRNKIHISYLAGGFIITEPLVKPKDQVFLPYFFSAIFVF